MDHDVLVKIMPATAGILHLSLNRPQQLNALSEACLQQLSEHLQRAKQDETVKAVLLSGEGKVFCAGADIKQLATLNGESGLAFARFGQSVLDQLESLGKPSLAALHGVALGGGCELAMACTLRLATEDTLLGQPEIKLGVIPGFGGTQRLSRLIGLARALVMCLTGKRINAQEALQWGLIHGVTSATELLTQAQHLLSEVIQHSPIAICHLLHVMQQGYDLPLATAQQLEATHFGLCCATQDKTEGVNAFLDKRSPIFIGE